MKKHKFGGKILIVGFGSIGQGVLPLILKHINIPARNIAIITADKRGEAVAKKYGINFIINSLNKNNYKKIILSQLKRGDFLLNVSVDVSSAEVIALCQKEGILYLDTVVEPWAGYYTDKSLTISERSNYALREKVLKLRKNNKKQKSPTAVIAHGANPGLISHFVKEALLKIAKDTGKKSKEPKIREEWTKLAQELGIKVIHIAEKDTQRPKEPKNVDEFINTWSVEGFYSEGNQPAELGWGTHEKKMPKKGRKHNFGGGSAIYLEQPGLSTQVRSWTPISGPQYGWIITHNESISIADYFTIKNGRKVIYRPTVHYAYHPCDVAVLSILETAEKGGKLQKNSKLINDEILSGGIDELGVLLMGHKKNALWYGSRLSIDKARTLIAHNNATGLQVTAGILGAMIWAMKNPNSGLVEADEIDHKTVMKIARPYLGKMFGAYTDWNPLKGRSKLFPEKLDTKDPWQFDNFLVF